MKVVFSNSQILSVFLARTQAEGRTRNCSMYFIDNEMFSYGSHYPLARIVGRTLLISEANSSATTNKHNYNLRHAAQSEGFNVIVVRNVLADSVTEHAENIAEMRRQAHELNGKAKRARKEWRRKDHQKSELTRLRWIQEYAKLVSAMLVREGLEIANRDIGHELMEAA